MGRVRKRGEDIRNFILNNVDKNPKNITHVASKRFNISRQAISKHIKYLKDQGALLSEGTTRNLQYYLSPLSQQHKSYLLDGNLEEDLVWRNDVFPLLIGFPENIIEIWGYCFTEMLNNAIEHSSGTIVITQIKKTATTTEIWIIDNGEGIFKNIKRKLGLNDERHSILELSKGKLTTDPERHTGEGIFFSSRMVDAFVIISGQTYFSHKHTDDIDWILENSEAKVGTSVFMKMKNNKSRTLKNVFDKYTSGDNFGFNKTVIPVQLAQYSDELLVSRSQAKRLLSRVDKFKTVILDFNGIKSIGQAFADEIFRVFTSKHRETNLFHVNANEEVEKMIVHVLLKI